MMPAINGDGRGQVHIAMQAFIFIELIAGNGSDWTGRALKRRRISMS
jgi:hypothetical protein